MAKKSAATQTQLATDDATTARPMGRPMASTAEIEPGRIYRLHEVEKSRLFGLAGTALQRAIKTGDIPAPMKITATGRARGWLGRVVLRWQDERLAAS